jgi:hypothetical protein
MNLDVPVVADEPELAEFVHANTGSGGADHLRQCFLTDVRTDWLQDTFAEELAALWNRDHGFLPRSDRTVSLTLPC